MRNSMKMFLGMSAAALIGMTGTIASAGDLGLIVNGDIETISRFGNWGDPGVGSVNGFPDGWHSSGSQFASNTFSSWSNGTTDPATSPTRSLWLSDDSATNEWAEYRSFATPLLSTGGARTLDISWNWDWSNVSGGDFGATIRISDAPVVNFDLQGNITREIHYLTTGASSGGFQSVVDSIALLPGELSFDIIFNTGDRSLADPDPITGLPTGKFDVTGTMFVDDVSATPEPASLALMGIGGLAALRRRRA